MNAPYRPRPTRRPGVNASKITEDDVRAIRRRHEAGETQGSLAREFGLSRFALNHVIHYRTWQHVSDG